MISRIEVVEQWCANSGAKCIITCDTFLAVVQVADYALNSETRLCSFRYLPKQEQTEVLAYSCDVFALVQKVVGSSVSFCAQWFWRSCKLRESLSGRRIPIFKHAPLIFQPHFLWSDPFLWGRSSLRTTQFLHQRVLLCCHTTWAKHKHAISGNVVTRKTQCSSR